MWRYVSGVIENPYGQSVDAAGLFIPLTKLEAEDFGRKIDWLYVGSNHLDVKTNVHWQNMYQAVNRDLVRMDTLGNLVWYKTATVPCHNCGLIVPYSDMQVDHYMPQVGGNYILKIFRALGLTTAASTGAKGMAIAGLDTLVMNPKGRDPGNYDHLGFSTNADKWTTNNKGTALLSLFAYAGGLDDLARFCRNSLLNLSPLCRNCNGIKSDWVRPIA